MIKPNKNYILIEPIVMETTTPGGIIIPEEVIKKDTPVLGTVLNANGHPEIKDGDRILLKMWAAEPAGDYAVVHFNDVLAIQED